MRTGTILIAVWILAVTVISIWPRGSAESRIYPEGEIFVAAAASVADALEKIAKEFEHSHGIRVREDFASSGLLRKKIKAGIKYDVFLSAYSKDLDILQKADCIAPKTRRNLLRNTLVCVVPADLALKLESPADLKRPEVSRIAVGDPDHVPAGMYFKEASQYLGLEKQISNKLVPCADARATLAQAEYGTVDAAVVYLTDAKITDEVRVAFAFPQSSHSPIVYPVCVLKKTASEEAAKKFLKFLSSDVSIEIFKEFGFRPILNEDK